MKSRTLIFCYQNFHALAFFPIGATHHAYFNHTKLIILIILDGKYKCGNTCYVKILYCPTDARIYNLQIQLELL